ncbi:MAG TPA: DUF6351 family protein [Thermoleophilaceae bacterium]|jgi:hypothetical protein
MRKAVLLAMGLALLVVPPPALGHGFGHLSLESLSADPGRVTGGDVLAAVDVPRFVPASKVAVTLGRRDVTDSFSADPADPDRLVGLVSGLRDGRNTLEASVRGHWFRHEEDELHLFNHPITGPVFSGPHQTPFICQTAGTDLGPPTDSDCSAPTRVDYVYRSTANTFKPLANPTDRPDDLAQTTTRDGRTVDYVVRVESGTINRAVYRFAVLAAGGEAGNGWNDRLVYEFGGGCGTGYHQGTLGSGAVLDNQMLSRGFAVASASLNTFGVACNDVLSAETLMMVKERFIEAMRTVPVWTTGWGGSGGAIQQIEIAQNYPGLLDGIMPSATFQDAQLAEPTDCRLLNRYFAGPGASLTAAQRTAIMGFRNNNTCVSWDLAFANVIAPDLGCDPVLPVELRYNAVTNPTGARCTVWDSMVNVYGRDPATGFARRTLDNVGVQYGLQALQEGQITVDQFLDLNENIGGYDNDGHPRPERAVADRKALRIAYRTGRVDQGEGGLPQVPIIDLRGYTDPTPDIHMYIHSYVLKERLRHGGSGENLVMWRAGGAGVAPMTTAAIDLMADWLDNLAADHSHRWKSRKVLDAKPDTAVDACWTPAGERIDDPAEIDSTGPCTQLYTPFRTPRMRAGQPLDSLAIKCRLRRLDPGEYGALTPDQEQRLAALYPDGVCDYSRSGVGERPLARTWISYGD